jgi:hypothetical protein
MECDFSPSIVTHCLLTTSSAAGLYTQGIQGAVAKSLVAFGGPGL